MEFVSPCLFHRTQNLSDHGGIASNNGIIGKSSDRLALAVVLIAEHVLRIEASLLFWRSFRAASRLITTRRKERCSTSRQTLHRLTVPAPFELPSNGINHVFFAESTVHTCDAGMSLQKKQPLYQFFSCSRSLGRGSSYPRTSFACTPRIMLYNLLNKNGCIRSQATTETATG